MTPEQREAAIAVEHQLHAIQNDPARDGFARHTAADYLSQVESLRHYLAAPDHKVVLIGGKGSGKSGWLAMVTGLHIGDQPRSNDDLRKRSVLPLGAGGTSVCELRIRRASEALCPNRNGADYGLTIEPKSDEDLLREIDLFAERMWKTVRNPTPQGGAAQGDDGGNADAPLEVEIDRLIRGMTGCTRQRTVQPTAASLQPVLGPDPLRQLIDGSSSLDDFKSALKKRAHLHARNKTEWWEHGDRDESLNNLKILLKAINSGLEPSSPFPAAITLWIPLSDDLDDIQQHLTFTDSRGFDQPLEGRADLQAFLRDERAVCILCVPFQAPPGNEFRNLLKTVLRTQALRTAIDRIRILIMDLGLASQVADANDDRIYGQSLKRQSCIDSLKQEGLESFSVDGERVYVFDALQDDLDAARTMVSDSVDQIRQSKARSLEDAIARASEFVKNVTIDHERALMLEVDNQLLQTFANNKPSLNQLDDAVEGVISLVKDEHAARVNAMCRRRGEYEDLDAYEAIRAAVESWFHEQHFRSLYVAMADVFQNLDTGPRYATVRSHVQTRKAAFEEGRLALGLRVSKVVQSELRTAMRSHAVWTECVNEFGRGLNKPPYRERVGGHIRAFGDQHTHQRPIRWDFTAQNFGLPAVPQPA